MLSEEKKIASRRQLNEYLDAELPVYSSNRLSTGKQLAVNLFLLTEKAILRKHQILLRKTEYYKNTRKRLMALFYSVRLNRLQNRHSLHIAVNCCGKGLRIMHVGPILMNGRVTVGENCSFHINTALVAGGSNDGVPTLGNGVVVGVGAVVLGNTYIADNVAVGANAVVNTSILEENIAVAGVPAKKISNNGRLEWNKGK